MTLPSDVAEPAATPAPLVASALALFDAAADAHGLRGKARKLLHLAAASYSLAAEAGGARVGRDIVLAAPLERVSPEQQSIVASAVALQREKARPRRESSFVWLAEPQQRIALALAAVLRLARALGNAPVRFQPASGDAPATLLIGGSQAAQLASSANTQAELWREAIGPLDVRAAGEGFEPGEAPTAAIPGAGLEPALAQIRLPSPDLGGEPMAESARRALRRFFDKLLAREEAVLKGEDSEDVHQMRVSTRRLRAALQTLEGVFEPQVIRRYRKGLRQIAQSLGAVRDGDVFLEHLHAQREGLPAADRDALNPLLAAVAAERQRAREALLASLGSKRYAKFKREFGAFLSTPGAGTLPPPELGVTQRLRDFAGSAIWRRYELWRAYEAALPGGSDETLHQARIAGKRFRYTLEFFAEPLGPRASQALDSLIELQECLGELQDIVTARAHVAALGLGGDPGAQAYLAGREAERAPLLAALPRLWEKVDSGTYRRRLFELIVKL